MTVKSMPLNDGKLLTLFALLLAVATLPVNKQPAKSLSVPKEKR
jgi:hypothetical protein